MADLRDTAQFVIDHAGKPIDPDFLRAVNATAIALAEIQDLLAEVLAGEQQTRLAVSVCRRAAP
ncbi:hypothetical protein A5642_21100 [Mycolicibacterium mucogenicum]|uniref:Uncharacterized protein n=1 Tax=Mycolicibacterium mucogenicum TaxID=56689 RepID=A0A1A0MNF2_MYCMU|nr:hypothetical protein [Mycolicibacterium mucogenicum]OBA86937.1 hypothetical protein A5642_21100 [Mycolicibacterium mucogenicum]